ETDTGTKGIIQVDVEILRLTRKREGCGRKREGREGPPLRAPDLVQASDESGTSSVMGCAPPEALPTIICHTKNSSKIRESFHEDLISRSARRTCCRAV